jgi:proton-translocating NADH-quinone oxidoreductase chain L
MPFSEEEARSRTSASQEARENLSRGMYVLIVLFPLLGSLFAGFGGRFLGHRGASVLSLGCGTLGFMASALAYYEVALSGSACSVALWRWCHSECFQASWSLYFDTLTVVMLVVITSVSTLVHLYSTAYMAQDPHLPRFLSYLSFFTFCMLMLVTADNFLQVFFGWEGVGLASYLLINFWFTRLQASKASIKAMLMNRVGDIGLALAMFAIFSMFHTVDFATVFACAPLVAGQAMTLGSLSLDGLTLIGLLLFLGAMGKSAQLGLHTWLPDAMEGPTPVSALIHAATMVTAGVFLLARCSPLLEWAPGALTTIVLVGSATTVFAATTALVQQDVKRVIAYSTASQLGYMMVACGLSQYALGMFHLVTHAFFKALLFLSAGAILHGLGDEQDVRRLGGARALLPFTYSMMLLGSLALVGMPFLAGYYSKDMILEVAWARWTMAGSVGYWLGAFVVACTAYYSCRLVLMTFFHTWTGPRATVQHAHEASWALALPLMVLALGSVFVGYLGRDMFIGAGTDFWRQAVCMLPQHHALVEAEYVPLAAKWLPLGSMVSGALLALVVQWRGPVVPGPWYGFLSGRWYLDALVNALVASPMLQVGYTWTWKALDKGALEVVGPWGLATTALGVAQGVRRVHSGRLYQYAVVMLLGMVVWMTWATMLPAWDARLGAMVVLSGVCLGFEKKAA